MTPQDLIKKYTDRKLKLQYFFDGMSNKDKAKNQHEFRAENKKLSEFITDLKNLNGAIGSEVRKCDNCNGELTLAEMDSNQCSKCNSIICW